MHARCRTCVASLRRSDVDGFTRAISRFVKISRKYGHFCVRGSRNTPNIAAEWKQADELANLVDLVHDVKRRSGIRFVLPSGLGASCQA